MKKTISIATISPITKSHSTYFHWGASPLMFGRILNATLSNNFLQLLEGLRWSSSPLVLGIFDSPDPQISWYTRNTKATRYDYRLTPRLRFLEGEPIHWVDKAKNVWIVGRLPIKAGWWDVSLALQGLRQKIANTPNYKNSRMKPSFSPIIGFNKKVQNIRIAKLIYVLPSREANSDLCGWTRPC